MKGQKNNMSVGVMYPIYKIFNVMIFDKLVLNFKNNIDEELNIDKIIECKKSFEFRTKLPKELQTGTKIYVYEPLKRGGCKKIVGEFTVGKILDCAYPIGAYPFMPYFCKNILNNETYAEKFEIALNTPMPHYKKGSAVRFALDEDAIKYIQDTGEWPKLFNEYLEHSQINVNWKKIEETSKVIGQCDEWLIKMGFYNDMLESNYKYALEILNPIKYDEPKELHEFKKLDGNSVLKAPQGFIYVQTI